MRYEPAADISALGALRRGLGNSFAAYRLRDLTGKYPPEVSSALSDVVPVSFFQERGIHPPKRLPRFLGNVVVPLEPKHLRWDIPVINSSWEHIRRTRGPDFPDAPISRLEDFRDLVVHGEEPKRGEAFHFAIFTPRRPKTRFRKKMLGCIYVYPPGATNDGSGQAGLPADADAAVSFLISRWAYEAGLYPKLEQFVRAWIRDDWPRIEKPYFGNLEKKGPSRSGG